MKKVLSMILVLAMMCVVPLSAGAMDNEDVYAISNIPSIRVTAGYGVPFEDIEMPTMVTVTRTDGVRENVEVVWNGSAYNPYKLGSQIVRGTLVNLPSHLTNPNNRQPNAMVTVVNP